MLDERLSSHIVHTDHFGRVESEVIDAATGWMNPASLEVLPNDLKWHVQVHHQVYLMGPVQGFSLCKGPGKTTQQSLILGDISQLLEQQPNHEVGWDELPLVREGLGQLPDFCVPSHVVSDQVPTGEGLQLEVFGNAQRQGALAGARAPTITECGSCLSGPWLPSEAGSAETVGPLVGHKLRLRARPTSAARHPGRHPEVALLQRVRPQLMDGVEEGVCELNDCVKTFPPGCVKLEEMVSLKGK